MRPDDQEPIEQATQSFVLKFWLEETAGPCGSSSWRGHVTHVPEGDRHYFTELAEIEQFIRPYLDRLAGEPGRDIRLQG